MSIYIEIVYFFWHKRKSRKLRNLLDIIRQAWTTQIGYSLRNGCAQTSHKLQLFYNYGIYTKVATEDYNNLMHARSRWFVAQLHIASLITPSIVSLWQYCFFLFHSLTQYCFSLTSIAACIYGYFAPAVKHWHSNILCRLNTSYSCR